MEAYLSDSSTLSQKHGVEILEFNPFRDEYWSFHIVGKKSA
ncbi:MAG: hypothetical protein ACREOW_19080 [Thermodesulfobacteriota bacterium]